MNSPRCLHVEISSLRLFRIATWGLVIRKIFCEAAAQQLKKIESAEDKSEDVKKLDDKKKA